jgi:hypothetical protein
VTSKKDHTLYAHWKEIPEETFSVKYDPNGGELKGDSSKLLHKDDKYGAFPSVIYKGYKLIGWFTEPDPEAGTQVSEEDTFSGGKDITLYAHWEFDPYGYWDAQLDSVEIKDEEKVVCCQITDYDLEAGTFDRDKKGALLTKSKAKNAGSKDDPNKNLNAQWLKDNGVSAVVFAADKIEDADTLRTEINDMLQLSVPEGKDPWEGEIIIVSSAASDGSDNEQLYYAIDLCNRIYGCFTEEDMAKAAEDLEVVPAASPESEGA